MVVALWDNEERFGGFDVEGFCESTDERTKRGGASGYNYEGCFDAEEDG